LYYYSEASLNLRINIDYPLLPSVACENGSGFEFCPKSGYLIDIDNGPHQ